MSSSRMTFILDARDNLSRVFDRAGNSAGRLEKNLIKLGAVGQLGGGPMAASFVAGAGALVGAFASAGLAAGAFGAAVQPQVKLMTDNAAAAKKLADAQETAARKKQVAAALEAKGSDLTKKAQTAYTSARMAAVDAEKAYARQTKGMPKATADAALSLAKLKSAHEKWSASLAKDTMPIFTKGLDAARKALPLLTPLVKTTAQALSDFMDGLDGSGMKGFIARINDVAKKTLPDLLSTGRNVFVGLGGIIGAFLPTSDKLTGGLEKGSAAFAKWGQGLGDSAGFKRFMDIAGEGSGSLAALAVAALDLYDAMRPISQAMVAAAEGAAKFIRWLPPDTLAYIGGSLLTIKLATLGIGAAISVLSAGPIGIAAAAIVILGAAFITAWQKSQTFREITTTAFAGVAQMALSQVRLILLGLRSFSDTAITTASGVASTLASAFGWMPEIGPKLKTAAASVEKYRTDTSAYFDDAIGKVDAYSAQVDKMPQNIRIKGDITSLQGKIAEAKAKLKDPSLTAPERTKLKADITDWNAQIVEAKAKLAGTPKQYKAKLFAQIDSWNSQIEAAKRKLASTPPSRQAKLLADIRDLQSKVGSARGQLNSLNGKTATTYIRTVYQKVDSSASKTFRRTGGPAPRFAGGGMPGGMLSGPGTGTSDSIPMWWASNGEYVVNARSTAKYKALIEAINSDSVGSSGGMGGAGMDVAKGLVRGMDASAGGVEGAARRMAGAVVLGIKGELQIASPSKRTTALAKDVGAGLIKGLTGSKAKIASTSKDLAKDIWAAFTGSKDNRLVAYVNRQTKTLTSLAGKRDSIAATIKRAKEFAETTRVGAKQSASLGGMFEGEEQVTASGINSKLQQRLAKMKTFTSYIYTLKKRGLNKTMLREILTMGPEEGYAYASALAGANSKLFKEINSTQYKINDQADTLGRAGADALYDSGKNAGKGFLKGLSSQQDAIEKQMLKIAKGMQAAIKKALGIKSPSTVMAEVGRYSTEGLAVGLVDRMPVLDRALSAVSGRVAATSPVMGRPAVAVGGGGGDFVVNVTIGNAMDPVAVAREFERVLLKYGRAQGTTVRIAR